MAVEWKRALTFERIEYWENLPKAEEEIERPRCYPLPVQFLLEFKLSRALDLVDGSLQGEQVLVACCGSGMDAEFLERRSMKVVGMDISFEALQRARERARRYGVQYRLVLGDAQNMPFRSNAVEFAFVHDGLHHLPEAYQGIREMMRVASRAVVIAEPADALLTKLAVRLGISGNYEDVGNFVYRLKRERLADIFSREGAKDWKFSQHIVYYQPWTFGIYKLFEREPLFSAFKLGFNLSNLLVGRWGNSLKAVAWKQ